MKVIEGKEPILKVYIDEDDEIILDSENAGDITLTPLEADRLSDLLKSICNKTKYFKGLKA